MPWRWHDPFQENRARDASVSRVSYEFDRQAMMSSLSAHDHLDKGKLTDFLLKEESDKENSTAEAPLSILDNADYVMDGIKV